MISVIQDGGAPIKSWAADVEDSARQQMVNISRLPFLVGHTALMPDAHAGYGMPIGGVFAADGYLVPYAIGVDIGCSVTLLKIDLNASEMYSDTARPVERLMDNVRRLVPVGNGPDGAHKNDALFGRYYHEPGLVYGTYMTEAVDGAVKQLGSLGGGNHFLELQVDEVGQLYFMIHSGSRSLGKKIADHHVRIAQKMNAKWKSQLPHKEVAYLPFDTAEGREYWTDMKYAMGFAEASHRAMSDLVVNAVFDLFGVETAPYAYCHHNFAEWEDVGGKNALVHRKGAVRAREGEIVLIPGSMSTGSYVARGLGNRDSLQTCQHGAGRARSRAATRKMITKEELLQTMDEAGVYLTTPGDVRDEASLAYKDIEEVMSLSTDLVEPLIALKPLGVVKG